MSLGATRICGLYPCLDFMCQSIRSITPPQPFKFPNMVNLSDTGNFFITCLAGGLPQTPSFKKFYTFPPLARSHSLSYPVNIYKFAGRIYINQ